jgi:flagellar hook-length control protein FliK
MISSQDGLTRTGRTEFTLRLDPPELGSVRVHLIASEQSVQARLVVSDEAARQIIQSQVHVLRQTLANAGVSLGSFDVRRDGSGSPNQGQGQRPWQPEPVPAPTTPEPNARPAALPQPAKPSPGLGRIDVVV